MPAQLPRMQSTWASLQVSSKTVCSPVTSKSRRFVDTWARFFSSRYQPMPWTFLRRPGYKGTMFPSLGEKLPQVPVQLPGAQCREPA